MHRALSWTGLSLLPVTLFDLKIEIVFSLRVYFCSAWAERCQPSGALAPQQPSAHGERLQDPAKPRVCAQSDCKQFANGFSGCFGVRGREKRGGTGLGCCL